MGAVYWKKESTEKMSFVRPCRTPLSKLQEHFPILLFGHLGIMDEVMSVLIDLDLTDYGEQECG